MQELYHSNLRETVICSAPPKVVRAPGRVNLIGEHTDYNGLPVLPIAIDREVCMEIAKRNDSQVILRNHNPRFEGRSFSLNANNERLESYEIGDWGNYVKAGLQGIIDEFKKDNGYSKEWKGFSATVSGNIPIASGLSSSSALVVASSMAFMAVNDIYMDKMGLAELLAKAERYVGTEGGGMDQAICLLGKPGHALKIDFFPLRTRPVKMPKGYKVVVCKSMIEAPKTKEARMKYNRRPIECKLACAVINQALKGVLQNKASFKRLGDVVSGISVELLNDVALPALDKNKWTIETLCTYLDMEKNDVQDAFLTLSSGCIFPEPEDGFKLKERAYHVISEAKRVEQAVIALEEGDGQKVGELMNQSHRSCRDGYEISCQELDTLVEIALDCGALGSRLTGAGFGGCTVSLLKEENIFDFMQGVKEKYYKSYLKDKHPDIYESINDYSEVIFICNPSKGASIEQRKNWQY